MKGDIMSKFYVFSDVHGFADELKEALKESGFDVNNPEHIAVCLGDPLDRGSQPQEVIDYLMSLPRKILVKGNHSILLMECIQRGYPLAHDWHNGTVQTIMDLAPKAKTFDAACTIAYEKVKNLINSEVNYYESANYIFVHSFIPLINEDGLPAYYTRNRKFSFNPDWRNASDEEWKGAMWGNPFDLAMKGLNQTGKIIVCGHWHCSAGWAVEKGLSEFGYDACFEPYYYKDKLIMLDAMTVHSGKVNMLVLEDEFLT